MKKQINNLTISFSRKYNKFQVITPDKRVLEEFEYLQDAETFAKGITDFKKIQKIEKITDIDKLCEAVNKKYGLKRNEIGSIEHHQDMCENSIVQIANHARGVVQLVCGENKTLVKYLQGILEDRIEFNIYRF